MIYGVNILFTWLLILTTGAVNVSPPNAIKSLDLPDEIKFEVVDGLMILKIPTATGLSNYIFDTGSKQLILHEIAKETTSQIVSVDATYDVSDIVLDRLSLGKATYDGVPALGMDLSFLSDQLDIEVNGILGAHIFTDYSLLIDYDNQVVELIDKFASPGLDGQNYDVVAIPFIQDNMDLPVIEIEIDFTIKLFRCDRILMRIQRSNSVSIRSFPFPPHDLSWCRKARSSIKMQSGVLTRG